MPGYLTTESESLQAECIVTNIWCRKSINVPCEVKDFIFKYPLGVTVDPVSLSWQIFDRSALASFELSVWVYLSSGEKIQAVSKNHKARVFMEIPEITDSMRIEAKFYIENIEVFPDESGNGIVLEASILLEGVVLEKRVLQVITGISIGKRAEPVTYKQKDTRINQFILVATDLIKRIIRFFSGLHIP
ncbi:MAG: hypothetical protein GX969_03995 [Firmicutes bacterium]|nr:hypothetical protein [Bacillota bacterium]